MLASVRWEADEAALAEPYYTLDLPPRWKLARRFGPVDLFAEDGKFVPGSKQPSLAVITQNEATDDFPAYVKQKNLNRNNYRDLRELDSRFVPIGGFDANISRVAAIDARDNQPVVMRVCYINIGKTVIFIEGLGFDALGDEAFDKACLSWKLRE
jgi:nitroreductase